GGGPRARGPARRRRGWGPASAQAGRATADRRAARRRPALAWPGPVLGGRDRALHPPPAETLKLLEPPSLCFTLTCTPRVTTCRRRQPDDRSLQARGQLQLVGQVQLLWPQVS